MGTESAINRRTKKKVSIPKPEYTEYIHPKHKHRVELIKLQSARLSEARESKKVMLTQEVEDGNDPEVPTNLDIL